MNQVGQFLIVRMISEIVFSFDKIINYENSAVLLNALHLHAVIAKRIHGLTGISYIDILARFDCDLKKEIGTSYSRHYRLVREQQELVDANRLSPTPVFPR